MKFFLFFLCLFAPLFAQIEWNTPAVDISPLADLSAFAQVAANPATGGAIAVWVDATGFIPEVQVSSFDGVSWSAPLTIATPALADPPSIAIDNLGRAIVVYTADTGGGASQIAAVRFNGVTWEAPVIISTIGANGAEIDMNEVTGEAVAVWDVEGRLDAKVMAAFFNGVTWSPEEQISPTSAIQQQAEVSYDSTTNTAIAVWESGSLGGSLIFYNIFNGATWGTATPLSTNGNEDDPQISAASGGAIAAWVTDFDTIQVTFFNCGSWGPILDISDPALTNTKPVVSYDSSNGTGIVLWVGSNGVVSHIYASNFDGISWSSPVQLSTNDSNDPAIAINPNNNHGVALWSEFNGSVNTIRSALYDGTTWLVVSEQISTDNSIASQVAINPTNNEIFGVWVRDSLDVYGVVQAISGEESAVLPPEPPVNLRGTRTENRFPTEAILTNILTWDPSPSPDIDHYNVYRNGVLIGQVLATQPLIFIDRFRQKGIVYTYTVTAVDIFGTESEGVSITL